MISGEVQTSREKQKIWSELNIQYFKLDEDSFFKNTVENSEEIHNKIYEYA
jgi:hypothetical protein